MKVKFKDGTMIDCSTPTEQKVFRAGEAAGWVLSFALIGNMTSTEVDKTISNENIVDLMFEFESEGENGTANTILLSGYNRVSSAIIKYDDKENSRVELVFTKGV